MKGSWRDPALACLSGVLLIFGFPQFDLGALAWVALVPLLVALDGKRPLSALVLCFTTGLIFFPGIFHWALSIKDYNLLDHAILGVYLSSYFAVFGLALAWLRKRIDLPMAVAAPPLWVASEYLRTHAGFLTFPWMLLGYSQYLHPSVIQVTSFTGIYGLGFLIVLTNALGADAVGYWRRAQAADIPSRWPRRVGLSAGIGLAILASTYGYGRVVVSQPLPDEAMRIAVVQGNVPQQGVGRQRVVDHYATLTRAAAQAAPALTVWPETAVPGDVKRDPALQQKMRLLTRETRTFLLVGASESAKFSKGKPPDTALAHQYYNSMLLLSPEGTLDGEYRKMVLVPFGEYEPLKGVIAWPKAIAASFGRMVPGDSYTLFSIDGRQFGAAICWEVIFPHVFREFVRRGALFMVNATNESWFGPTAAPYQLLAMATIRAAENRVAIARAANTGLSAFIDPYGRITDRVKDATGRELFVEGVLVHDVPLSRTRTFYTRYGDVFAFLQIGLAAVLLLYAGRPLGLRATRRTELPA